MTSSQPQSSTIPTCVKPEHITANHVPSTEERFAVLGHEIRNPLCALNAALEAWPATMDEPQLVDDLLQIMRRQVSQLTRLCNDLLDAGRISQGVPALHWCPVDAGQVIQNACEEIRPLIAQRGLTITVALGRLPLTVLGDPSKLTQVFANLLHNAAKFTDRHGHLQIDLEQDHDTAVIRLCDNGCGICADQLQEIFLPRSAAMGYAEHPGSGLGIGLPLANTIVELHGGTIDVFSQGLGHGSTFVVRLPIASKKSIDPPAMASQPSEIGQGDCSHLPSYQALVVDDDRSIRYLLARLLTKLEQQVTVAKNGQAALEAIIRTQPRVVFLDLNMQGISGYEVARQIRMRDDLDDIVLIALSGNGDTASRQLAAESGFDQYLVKPTGAAELTEALLRVGELSMC